MLNYRLMNKKFVKSFEDSWKRHKIIYFCRRFIAKGVYRYTKIFITTFLLSGYSAVRLAYLLWEQVVAGSNPATPTLKIKVLHLSKAFFNVLQILFRPVMVAQRNVFPFSVVCKLKTTFVPLRCKSLL